MGAWIDTLNSVADNTPDVWDLFLIEFTTQFQDFLCEEQAHIDLENCQMCYPYISEYISKFKGLTCLTGYTQGNPEVTHYFLKGLTSSILEEVMRGAAPTGYAVIKQKAIDATRSQQLLNSLLSQ
jgi:hypothetical protein